MRRAILALILAWIGISPGPAHALTTDRGGIDPAVAAPGVIAPIAPVAPISPVAPIASIALPAPVAPIPPIDPPVPQEGTLTTTPTGKGLPVVVRLGLFVGEIESIDEKEGTFVGTVDLRLRWEDDRLEFPVAQAPPGGFVDIRGEAAEARLAQIWTPDVRFANLIDQPAYQVRRLRIAPAGRVEIMQRTTGKFKTSFDFAKFPFDRQELTFDLVERREPLHRLALDFRQDDVEFSRAAASVAIDGWDPGLLHLERAPIPAWYGESQARVLASLEIYREAGRTVSGLFLPLLASLLIPLLALWLQRVGDGTIDIEAFELSNILIGGLFAVIALNFTISANNPSLVGGDNAVTRLLGLNYLCLATSLVINVIVFRFNLIGRLFGKHILIQVYRYLTWAMPVLVFSTAAAILLVARV